MCSMQTQYYLHQIMHCASVSKVAFTLVLFIQYTISFQYALNVSAFRKRNNLLCKTDQCQHCLNTKQLLTYLCFNKCIKLTFLLRVSVGVYFVSCIIKYLI